MAKILIIGGGVAGLSAGIYALKNGHSAIICERHKVAGGNLTGWQRGEYHIDNCIHWLTGTNPNTNNYKMWLELGAIDEHTQIYQSDTLYTCESEGLRLSLNKNLSVLERDMFALSPVDKKEIFALTSAIRTVKGLFGTAGKAHNKNLNFWQILFGVPALLPYCKMSTEELSKRFKHPLLQKFITCFFGKNFTALALLVTFAIFCGENGGIPQGGSFAMAQRIVNRFLSLGGKLLLSKDATKIKIENGKAKYVVFSDATIINADYVISTADTKVTFEQLLGQKLPKNLQKYYDNPQMKRFSAFQCAFSCDTDRVPFSADIIFELSEKHKKKLSIDFLILREFSHEKSFAPKGKTVLQTLIFCNEKKSIEFIQLRKNKEAYTKFKIDLANKIKEIIIEKFPLLKDKIKLLDVWTPATYQRYTKAEIGSFMSFILPKNKLPLRLKSKIRGLKNVFLATQWQQPPGGLPTAAQLGKIAIDCINKKEKKNKNTSECVYKNSKKFNVKENRI